MSQPESSEKAIRPDRKLEDIISPDLLHMISQSSGFRFIADRQLAARSLQSGNVLGGYTEMETRVIHINELLISGASQLGIEPWTDEKLRGLLIHEAGHHHPVVKQLQDALMKNLNNPETIPETYRGDPGSEERFKHALHSHLHNALADVWDESYMGRRPYFPIRNDVDAIYQESDNLTPLVSLSRPEQLIQLIVRLPHHPQLDYHQEGIKPEVAQALDRIRESGAMEAVLDRKAFENYFATDGQRERTLDRKFEAYKKIFLPEYLSLVEQEVAERKEQRQQQKQGTPQIGQGEGQPQSGGAVPLTKEEEQEVRDQLLRELEKAGQEFGSQAPSKEESEEEKEFFDQLRRAIAKRHQELAEGKSASEQTGDKPQPKGKSGIEQLRDLSRQMLEAEEERQQRGLAAANQVKEESVKSWKDIKGRRKLEIESTAGALAEIFLDDRRKRLEYLRREGEIVPGLEYETISAFLSGDLDPETKMQVVTNPEFLELEHIYVIDTSGSMSGDYIKKAIDLMVIEIEALKLARATMADESLLTSDDEQPFRIGGLKFSIGTEVITPLEEPLSDKKELKLIDEASKVGGGTDETDAIQAAKQTLSAGRSNVIKMITVLTDGYGNREGLAPIMKQIESDNEIIFLACGFGETDAEASAVTSSYLAPLANRDKNVFAISESDPEKMLPKVLEFLKREVGKRRFSY